jgi:predicted Zn-ribbon and HTH transcriptional regulator
MKMITVKRPGWRCKRCGHDWIPKAAGVPTTCPKCKSPYWNRPRKKTRAR